MQINFEFSKAATSKLQQAATTNNKSKVLKFYLKTLSRLLHKGNVTGNYILTMTLLQLSSKLLGKIA